MSKLAKFRMEALKAHNSYREMHGVPPLEYDIELESSAQAYADDLVDADELRVSHGASLGIYGENISRRTSSAKSKPDISGAEVTSLWYRDIEKFDYVNGAGRAGNFTQLVWRDSHQFGIGKAQVPGRVVVVAHYGPAGNVRGLFLENVPPPLTPAEAHQQPRHSPKDRAEPDDMLNYRVRSREVDTKVVRDGRAAVMVRRELVEYEDTEGRLKHKFVEERHQQRPEHAGGETVAAEAESDDEQEEIAFSDDDDENASGSDRSTDRSAASKEAAVTATAAVPADDAGRSHHHDATEMTIQEGAAVRGEHKAKRNPAELHKFAKHVSAAVSHHRKRHDAKPLRLSAELCEMAQSLAEELAVSTEKLRPSSTTYRGQRLGQSLAARVSAANTDASAEHVVGLWYAEGKKYNFHQEPTDVEPFGNFTQLVWKSSQELGVGRCTAQLPDGTYKLVVVCYFFPTGNVSKEFLTNVQPPKK